MRYIMYRTVVAEVAVFYLHLFKIRASAKSCNGQYKNNSHGYKKIPTVLNEKVYRTEFALFELQHKNES
jgi:hypothetical protein